MSSLDEIVAICHNYQQVKKFNDELFVLHVEVNGNMKKAAIAFIAFSALMTGLSASLGAQCQPVLALASSASGSAYYVRMAVHFGEVYSVPNDIICSRSLIEGENVVSVPVWIYNLHQGIDYVEFSVASNESLGVFIPDNSFAIVSSVSSRTEEGYRIDLIMETPTAVCGSARLGYAEVHRVNGCDPVWIDLGPNAITGRMIARDASGELHYVFSPQHGGYLGQEYLYACQEPICEEPNMTATCFEVVPDVNCRVRLRWNAGSGNCSMIRWSTNRYPTSIADGELAVEIPTSQGQIYDVSVYHEELSATTPLYYTVFSITRDPSGLIVRDSFVECVALGYTYMRCPVATEETSWGTIKSLYR